MITTDDFVYACYVGILGREPNPEELQQSKSKLDAGTTAQDFILYFTNCEEFRNKTLVSFGIQDNDITNDTEFMALYERCKAFTLTSIHKMYALYKAVEYLVRKTIPGDIVECGVWRGGSSMLAAHSLLHFGDKSRTLYLYDTYTGMSAPGEHDVRFDGVHANELWTSIEPNSWWPASLDEVRTNMLSTGYPADRTMFVEGLVQDTIPRVAPCNIALLRLDTDWYESTKHELIHLYPLLSTGGVTIIDDYGWWTGSKKAAEEYFQTTNSSILLNRIALEGARLGVKL